MSHDVVDLCKELIALPSINPMGRGQPPAELCGEGRVNDYVLSFARAHRLDTVIQKTGLEGRENVGILFHKSASHKTILFHAHTDTVDVGEDTNLLRPAERDGRIYGRGACDDKGALAALLSAMAHVSQNPREAAGNILLFAVADEEYSWRGAAALVSQEPSRSADLGVVCEPTSCALVNGYKGVARWDIRTSGVRCHSSEPERGDNAIYKMGQILLLIRQFHEELARRGRDEFFGHDTLSVGAIRGGTAVNIVPDHCEIEIDARLVRGTTPAGIRDALAAYLRRHGVEFPFESSPLKDAEEAALLPAEHPGMRLLQEAARALGEETQPRQVAFGSDAYRMNAAGIPTALWGPGSIRVAHGPEEFCEVRELHRAVAFYRTVMSSDLRGCLPC